MVKEKTHVLGKHLLVNCSRVDRDVCLDDKKFLETIADAARRAGSTVVSQVRYHLGHNSPPGFTCVVLLDESHISAHTYADKNVIALDIFTCGKTDPYNVLDIVKETIDLGDLDVRMVDRFLVCE